jgi:hypothetical protein
MLHPIRRRETISSAFEFHLMRFCRTQDFRRRDSRDSMLSQTFSGTIIALVGLARGYPIPLSKKSCALVVTYQQCVHHHFEKTSGPLKRKYFMNFFLSNCPDYYSRFRVSIRRADSTPCDPISKAAA